MKILFDLFPVILFFVIFKVFGVYAATAAAIAATLAQVAWVKYRHGKVDTMLWVSLGIIVVFGGATLLLHDETFIKWKPTVLYWFFAAALIFSRLLFGKNFIRSLLEEKMSLPDPVWHKLNLAWSAFFAILGVVNLYVAYNYSLDAWVNFKLFGATSMMFVFIVLQAFALSKYSQDEKKDTQ
ncbi:MAG: septation protein A [Methylococcaceae bacterium]